MKEINNKKTCLNTYNFLELLMKNELDDEFIKDYLVSMYERGITAEELYEAVVFLKQHSKKVDHRSDFALDTCGTGGDGKKTINVSSAVSIVLSTLGYPVLKHGNHSKSSLLGSADIFKEIGIKIDLEGDRANDYFSKHNFLFLYAPKYQLAMHKVKEIRKRLNHPTIFNYVGPLINPGNPNFQIIGVPNTLSLKMYTETASKFKENAYAVYTSLDGFDEVSTNTKTLCNIINGGEIYQMVINPGDFFKPFPVPVVNSKKESISLFLEALKGENEKLNNLISINSALAIYLVSGASLEYAFYYAKRALQRKKVWRKYLSLKEDSYI